MTGTAATAGAERASAPRPWRGGACARLAEAVGGVEAAPQAAYARLEALVEDNRRIHERETLNLDPAANVMSPRAERLLAAGLGTRPSLGAPGDKYETGLEAIERIELMAAELACGVFGARFAETRTPSGAIANLMTFMALAKPGERIVAPPAAIAGHVTHHGPGCAGLYGLEVIEAPVDAGGYTVDVAGLGALCRRVRPAIVTLGQSLNLTHHPVAAVRAICDAVGARLVFDAAHLSGPIAGGAWPNPLAEGAHVMTMSTYKSLAGPPGGLIVTDDAEIAERLDAIAYPGLTANHDAGRVAALAATLLDWRAHGRDAAEAMRATAAALAEALAGEGLPVFTTRDGPTRGHAFALEAEAFGGGQAAARRLRRAGLLACGIGLPTPSGEGLRLGVSEIVRRGVEPSDAPTLARLIARGLREPPEPVAAETAALVAALRARCPRLRFVQPEPEVSAPSLTRP